MSVYPPAKRHLIGLIDKQQASLICLNWSQRKVPRKWAVPVKRRTDRITFIRYRWDNICNADGHFL